MSRSDIAAVTVLFHSAAFFLCRLLLGVPERALGTLGWLAAFGFCSVVIFLCVTSFTHRLYGTSGDMGVTLLLLAAIGAVIALIAIVAVVVGNGIAVIVVGASLVTTASAVAAAGLSE